jgi:hypothetical protein
MRSYWNLESAGIVKVQSPFIDGFEWSQPWAYAADTYVQGTFSTNGFYRYYLAMHDSGFRWLEHIKAFDDYYVVIEVADCPLCGANQYQYTPCINMWGRAIPSSKPNVCMPCTVCTGSTVTPCGTTSDTVCADLLTFQPVISSWRYVNWPRCFDAFWSVLAELHTRQPLSFAISYLALIIVHFMQFLFRGLQWRASANSRLHGE